MRSVRPLTVVSLLAIALGLLLGPPAAAGSAGKATVTGTVTFQGEPLEGASVTVYRSGKEYYTWTNSRGKYKIKVPAGKVKVSAHSYDVDSLTTYNSNTRRKADAPKLTVKKGKTSNVNIKLTPAATVTGRVVDRDGKPVRGYKVRAQGLDYYQHRVMAVTNHLGEYTTQGLAPGKTQLTVLGDFYLDENAWHEKTIVTAKRGKVVRAPDIVYIDEPRGVLTVEVSGALEAGFLRAYEVNDKHPFSSATFDEASGLWRAELLPGTWELLDPDYGFTTGPVTVSSGVTTHAGVLTIPPSDARIRLEVRDPKGRATNDLSPEIRAEKANFPIDLTKKKSKGRYLSQRVPAGRYLISEFYTHANHPSSRSKYPQVVDIAAGKTTTVTYRQPRTVSVSGVVRYRGKPVRNTFVYGKNDNSWGRTDSKGRFTVRGSVSGQVTLLVSDPFRGFRNQEFTFKAKRDITGKVLRLTK